MQKIVLGFVLRHLRGDAASARDALSGLARHSPPADDAIGRRLVHLFEQMNAIGTTVIVATHNEELIRRTPHEVLVLDRGRVSDPGPRSAGPDDPAGEDA